MEYRPLKQNERIELIDALRGFALFGILMVNLPLMYQPMSQMMAGADPDASTLKIIGESFIKFFFEGKFYVIFSMLFGFGFWIFMNKSKGQEKSTLPIFKRRLLFLLLFGIAHISLLWAGDVLLFYALFGFLLLLFRKSSDKKIIRWAIVLALLPTILMALMMLIISLFSQVPEAKETIGVQFQENMILMEELINRAAAIYSTGSLSEIISIRIEEYLTLLSGTLFFFCPVILAMFLTGFLIARKGIVSDYEEKLSLMRKVFWWGLVIGIITSALYTISYRYAIMSIPNIWALLSTSMHTIGGISLGLCYVSGITILFIKGKSGFFRKFLVPIGRMALTNYLMQSIIAVLLFHSYGLGLFGKIAVWQSIILTVIIFALQALFSRWWLSQYQFGPFEWVWRSLTYRKFQPMKKQHRPIVETRAI
ncbi:MAG: DUF418 domain-containing protein [Bacteroidota bacterium]